MKRYHVTVWDSSMSPRRLVFDSYREARAAFASALEARFEATFAEVVDTKELVSA